MKGKKMMLEDVVYRLNPNTAICIYPQDQDKELMAEANRLHFGAMITIQYVLESQFNQSTLF